MNRRDFLKASAASAVAAGAGFPVTAAVSRAGELRMPTGKKARNIIFLVSDGMSSGTLSMADQYLRWRDGRPSHWMQLYETGKVYRGLMETASLNNIVTDSAAASSAWGGGHRVNNDSVNVGPNGEHYEPILVSAKKAGKSAGVVTTATVTHATPAGFIANIPGRWQEEDIAVQYLEREVDVMLGGGVRFFDAEHRSDDVDLIQRAKQEGYAFVDTTEKMKAAAHNGKDKVLGLFTHQHVPYELDRLNDADLKAKVPSLKEMTQSALHVLNRNSNGFVVQIEGARVDHAAHSNDVGGLIFDQIAFDDAVGAAMDFAESRDDTLVIVTTDHGNANPGLNSGWNGGHDRFSVLSQFRGTHSAIFRRLNEDSSLGKIWEVVGEVTKIGISRARARLLHDALRGQYDAPYHRFSNRNALLGQILANETDIGWVGGQHTSDHVELAAFGPGSEGIKAFNKNTDLHGLMAGTWA